MGGTPFYGMTYTGGTDPSQGGILFSFTDDTVPHTLTITKTGAGTGSVTSVPSGINCGSTCSFPFSQSGGVTLTAAAATGSTFAGWSGGGCSGTGTCKVTMSNDLTVTASFTLNNYTLTASITGTGTGNISATNLSCNGNSCSGIYPYNTQVNILASPLTGSTFGGWSGCDSTSSKAKTAPRLAGKSDFPTTCTVTMTTGKSVTATFTLSTYAVTASAPGGNGTVSSPQQIGYGGTATITMTAAAGYDVYSITDNGTPVTVANPYIINNVAAAHSVVVAFSKKAALSVGKAGSGKGTVTSAPSGISCGATHCSYDFPHGTKVALTAQPDVSSLFAGWSGACSGATCKVTINDSTHVTATFDTKEFTVTASAPGGHGTVSPPQQIAYGSTATVAITPSAGYMITQITDNGAVIPIAAPYVIKNVTKAHAVVVTFTASHTFTVNKAGSGTGTVKSAPQGINCGATCEYTFKEHTPVNLNSTPDTVSVFKGWSGDCTGMTCNVKLDHDISVTATFVSESEITITPHVTQNFGNVKPGNKSAPVTFTVTNKGKKAVDISSVSFAGAGSDQFQFNVQMCAPSTLKHGDTCTLKVQFAPTSVGLKNAQLQVFSDDTHNPQIPALL